MSIKLQSQNTKMNNYIPINDANDYSKDNKYLNEEVKGINHDKRHKEIFKCNKPFNGDNFQNIKTNDTTKTSSCKKNQNKNISISLEEEEEIKMKTDDSNLSLLNPFCDGTFDDPINNNQKFDDDLNINTDFEFNRSKNNINLLKKKRKLTKENINKESTIEEIFEEIRNLYNDYNKKYKKNFELIPNHKIYEQINDSFEQVFTISENKVPGCCIYFNKYLISKIYLIREQQFLSEKNDILDIFGIIKKNILQIIHESE